MPKITFNAEAFFNKGDGLRVFKDFPMGRRIAVEVVQAAYDKGVEDALQRSRCRFNRATFFQERDKLNIVKNSTVGFVVATSIAEDAYKLGKQTGKADQ